MVVHSKNAPVTCMRFLMQTFNYTVISIDVDRFFRKYWCTLAGWLFFQFNFIYFMHLDLYSILLRSFYLGDWPQLCLRAYSALRIDREPFVWCNVRTQRVIYITAKKKSNMFCHLFKLKIIVNRNTGICECVLYATQFHHHLRVFYYWHYCWLAIKLDYTFFLITEWQKICRE